MIPESGLIPLAKDQPLTEAPAGQIDIGKRSYETITISACATGGVNAFAHRERLGWVGASVLALFIMGFLEVTAVAESRIREIKAAAAERDIIAIRRAAAGNHSLLLMAARIRGWMDGMKLAIKLLKGGSDHLPPAIPYLVVPPDDSPPLCLPGEIEEPDSRKVTEISGKWPRR